MRGSVELTNAKRRIDRRTWFPSLRRADARVTAWPTLTLKDGSSSESESLVEYRLLGCRLFILTLWTKMLTSALATGAVIPQRPKSTSMAIRPGDWNCSEKSVNAVENARRSVFNSRGLASCDDFFKQSALKSGLSRAVPRWQSSMRSESARRSSRTTT